MNYNQMDKNKKTDSIKKDFEQKGFTVIKNFFPKKKINFIKKSLFEYVKKTKIHEKKRDPSCKEVGYD